MVYKLRGILIVEFAERVGNSRAGHADKSSAKWRLGIL